MLLQFFINLALNDTAVKRREKGFGQAPGMAPEAEGDYDTKRQKLRVFYSLCVMVFAINPKAKHPIHLLLADVVKALGGRLTLSESAQPARSVCRKGHSKSLH
jgi:hypothetical protein